jgi:hypothetical protein
MQKMLSSNNKAKKESSQSGSRQRILRILLRILTFHGQISKLIFRIYEGRKVERRRASFQGREVQSRMMMAKRGMTKRVRRSRTRTTKSLRMKASMSKLTARLMVMSVRISCLLIKSKAGRAKTLRCSV